MVKQNTVEGCMRKKVLLEPGWISDDFEFREPEFYKIVTTLTRDDEKSKYFYFTRWTMQSTDISRIF